MIDSYNCGGKFFLDRDGLQKLFLLVDTMDFEKLRAIYGMCLQNYVGVKHERFRLCLLKVWKNYEVVPLFTKKYKMYLSPTFTYFNGSVSYHAVTENGAAVVPPAVVDPTAIPTVTQNLCDKVSPWRIVIPVKACHERDYIGARFVFSFRSEQTPFDRVKVETDLGRVEASDVDNNRNDDSALLYLEFVNNFCTTTSSYFSIPDGKKPVIKHFARINVHPKVNTINVVIYSKREFKLFLTPLGDNDDDD
jgi:hypothetical protein